MDKKNTKELVVFILLSIQLIEERFQAIGTCDDFLEDSNGLEKLDSISMRLQSIGEAIYQSEFTPQEYFLVPYSAVDCHAALAMTGGAALAMTRKDMLVITQSIKFYMECVVCMESK